MNHKVIVFLIIFVKISIAVPLSNDWNCPNTTSCSSVLHKSCIKISCPQLSIAIFWNEFEESPSINIDCLDLDEYFLGDIPICQYQNSSIENFYHVRIRGCPLPADKSIKTSFKIFENSSVNILEWYSHSDLNRQHFIGLENLEELILKENGLSDFRDGLFDDLTNLKILDLTFNKLNILKKNIFAKLKNLEILKLGHNYLKILDNGIFQNQNMLDTLELWSNNLKNLTKETFEGLSSLCYLDLSSNYIERFQSDIFSTLVDLTALKINENNFKSLPEKLFENNKKLVIFHMRENHFLLDTLPSGFLSNLKELAAVHISCGLTHISEDLFNGSLNLKEVVFDHNSLKTLPVKLLANQSTLFKLNLQHNQLNYLPSGLLADTTNLKHLILSNNQLENISGFLFNSSRDIQIDMSHNKIKKLSTRFLAEFIDQESLDLSDNEIVEVDFTEMDDFIPKFHLLKVYLKNNPIYCNCDILHFIKYIRNEQHIPTENFLKLLPENLKCSGPENMDGVLIVDVRPTDLLCPLKSTNSSEENCPNNCSCMVRPADQTLLVNCSNTNLHDVPDLPELLLLKFESTELNISHNHIKELPIISSANVTKLYAQNNLITKISIQNIPDQLRVIDLSNNNLEDIHLTVLEKFNKSSHLQFLRLSENSWKCDCETLSFRSFLQQNFEIIEDLNEVKCSNGKTIFKMSEKDICFIDPFLLVVISLAVIITIGVIISIIYFYQLEIKIWLFVHNICVKEVVDEVPRFDAYILYSNIDGDFVINDLVPELENGSNPFKLCLSERDFVLNEMVSTQIEMCVNESRRTIIILSLNFLKTIWNRTDFRSAYEKAKIIFILYEDVGCIGDLDDELKACINKNIYIKWGDQFFWQKLRYAMPHIRRRIEVVDELELKRRNQMV